MPKPSQLLLRRAQIALIVLIVLIGGCARLPGFGRSQIKAGTPEALHAQLRGQRPSLELFRSYGPFEVTRIENLEIGLSGEERYQADLFLPEHKERAPLVIFVHGYGASRASHEHQAMHLASWGMLGLTLDLPNTGPWDANALILARLVANVAREPGAIDSRIDVNRLLLVGHSFGAAAVASALAQGAPAAGAILLDPAVAENGLPRLLSRIQRPLMILGADAQVSVAKDRDHFYRFARNGVFEVSIKDAIHEDAQFPSDYWRTSEPHQITFAAALTAAALSQHMSGRFDYAWASYGAEIKSGQLIGARRK